MKRIAVALALLSLVACGRDRPKLAPVKTSTTEGFTTVPPSSFVTTSTTQAPPTGAPAFTTSTTLVPADSQTPAAGACANAAAGGAAVITLNPDVPSPRCVIVHSLNQLTFANNTDATQTVDTGYDNATLAPHATHAFSQNVGDYWARGVHRIKTGALYNGSGPEVWLQGS